MLRSARSKCKGLFNLFTQDMQSQNALQEAYWKTKIQNGELHKRNVNYKYTPYWQALKIWM